MAEARSERPVAIVEHAVRDPLVLTAADVAAAAGGTLVAGDPRHEVSGFSIDSRTLAPGALFFAIRGERHDGHAFVLEAAGRGACGLVVSAPVPPMPDAATPPFVVRVDDVVRALQHLARHVRTSSGTRVVAITGSAGKTTTKAITADLLAERYDVFRSPGNLNNLIGLPLSLLELRRRPEVAVVELGMSQAGEIRTLAAIAEPDIRVWTNVGLAHAASFSSIERIADAKAEILDGAGPGTVLVANAADPYVMARVGRFAGRLVTFGVEVSADVAAVEPRDLGLDGMAAILLTRSRRVELRVPLIGRGHLENTLAAIAVALECEVPLDAILRRAAWLRPLEHRGEVLRLPGGIIVIDDTYNSNPAALRGALEVVAHATGSGRKVAVVGEMLELGAIADDCHAEGGRAAARARLDRLVTVGGPAARSLGEAAVAAGLPASAVHHVPDSEHAAALAASIVRPGDLVLVKGSRGVRTDRVVDRLKAEFA